MARAKKKETSLTIEEKLAKALVPKEEQPYPLPENWCWVKVDTLSTLLRGVSYKKKDAHSERQPRDCLILRGGNIGEGYIDMGNDNIYVNMDIVSTDQLVQVNDVIIVASTGSTKVIGRAGVVLENYSDVAFGAFLMAVRPNKKANPRFIDYYFQSSIYRNRIRNLASGININNIRADYVTESPIPLPPLPEQQRIVTLIESLFADLDAAKEKLQAVLDGFAERRAALLHQAFTGELTREWREENEVGLESWGKKPLCEVTENHDSKRIPLSQKERKNLNRKYDYYGASGIIDKVDRYIFDGKYLLIGEDGANLITRSKPIAFIAEGQYWVNNHAHVLSMSPSIIMEFLCYHINSIDLVPYVTGSAQPKMTQTKMNKIPIPLPTLAEQKEIVHILDEVFAKESQSKAAVESALAEIETMKKAILATAFRGGFGTNDNSDESAEELLRKVL